MSTYLYLECRQHTPPLRADDESGQHLADLPNIQQDVRDREVVARLWRELGGDFGYFRNNTFRFLAQHDSCPIGIVDEYGGTHPLRGDTQTELP